MNLKKILTGIVAGAMAVSAMSIAAFAEAANEKKTVTVPGLTEPYLMFCLNTGDKGDVTVDWTVKTADNEEAGKGSKDFESEGSWWQQLDLTIEEVCGDVDPTAITGVTFNCPLTYVVGYNTTNDGAWGQTDPVTGEATFTDVAFAPYTYDTEVEVNTLVTGVFEAGTSDGAYASVVYNAACDEEKEVATLTIKDDDVVVAVITVPEDVDASKMVISLKGYDSSWSGWKDVVSEEGSVVLQTTVKAIREANGFENAEDLFGVNLEISGLADGAKVSYVVGTTAYVTIEEKPAESTPADTTDPDATEDPDATTDPDATDETTTADDAVAGTGEGTGTPTGTGDNNQPTGIAIAVVPAVIAAAGVIVAKKRK